MTRAAAVPAPDAVNDLAAADVTITPEAPSTPTAIDLAAAASLFRDHPHITIFPGDGIDVMPVVTGPPDDAAAGGEGNRTP